MHQKKKSVRECALLLSVRKDSKILFCPNLCPALTFPYICFFSPKAPRRAAVKTEKPDKSEGEKTPSAERKTSADEGKDTKG